MRDAAGGFRTASAPAPRSSTAMMYWAVVGIPIPRMKQAIIVKKRVKKSVSPVHGQQVQQIEAGAAAEADPVGQVDDRGGELEAETRQRRPARR